MHGRRIIAFVCHVVLVIANNTAKHLGNRDISESNIVPRESAPNLLHIFNRTENAEISSSTTKIALTTTRTSMLTSETDIVTESDSQERWGRGYRGGGGGGWSNGNGCGGVWRRDASYWRSRYGNRGWNRSNGWNGGGGGCYSSAASRALPVLGLAFLMTVMITTLLIMNSFFRA